jgi:colicin import membrane protein
MNTAALPPPRATRDPFMPRSAQRNGPALALALLAHVLLIAALAFGVNWHTFEPTPMAAELWSALPQAAAPRAVEPPPAPVEAAKPPPAPKPEPVPKPQAPVLPDPQIAIDKAKREQERREQQAADDTARQKKIEREKAERAKDELAQKKAAEKLKAEKEKAERDQAEKLKAEKAEKTEKAEAARLAAIRDANLKRMQGLAGATGGPTDTGTALHSSGPSASYAGRIMARIKPNIVFTDTIDGNPMATVEVRLAPDGTIVAKRLIKSSGVKSWDDAVLRAIERTEVLPRDIDGRVPPPFQIDFRPRD